ncbi:MAG: PQQ-binding-like beta-propeller repeat protein, partial [Rhodospirillaceae bacterium]|nr:PQQ-binding-like beta-propeller repeat protein [Rhodospirillaceae bacterium]
MNRLIGLAAIALITLSGTAALSEESRWSTYAGNSGGQQFSALDQINTDNVGQIEVAWQYRSGELERRSEFHNATAKVQVNPILLPIAAGGHLMICTPFNRIIALDPKTGVERWTYDPAVRIGGYATPDDPEGLKSPAFANCRGVTYWEDESLKESAVCRHRILTATNDLRLIGIDALSGKPCENFGDKGIIEIERSVLDADPPAAVGEVRFSNPPVVVNDVIIIGSGVRDNHRFNAPSGAVRAFDIRTGAPRWVFDPIPRDPADPMHAEWPDDSAKHTGGANVWGPISADEARDLVFLPTSGPSPDFFGGTRPGDNRYADSIVALRGSTGKVVWHFQTVHHDVWDYDNAAQPTLIELEKDDEPFPAVIQATKTGMVYIFHRETGEPFFPIEERPVPQDGVPGEQLSPTQPFPTKPPPLVPHDIGPDDFWGITFFDEGQCRKKYAGARLGPIFTPPSREGTIIIPATAGGMNWGGVAVDPNSKILIAKTLRMAHFAQLIPLDELDDVIESSGINCA